MIRPGSRGRCEGLLFWASQVLLESRSGRRWRLTAPLRSQQTMSRAPPGCQHLGDRHARGARSGDDDAQLAEFLLDDFEGVESVAANTTTAVPC